MAGQIINIESEIVDHDDHFMVVGISNRQTGRWAYGENSAEAGATAGSLKVETWGRDDHNR